MGIKATGSQPDQAQKFAPDAEIIFREWAVNNADITDVCSTRVATRLPRNATLPFLTFFSNGGTMMTPRSEAFVSSVALQVNAFAGKWGGGSSSQPDYATALQLANGVAEAALKTGTTRVVTPTSATAAVIYSFEVVELPIRVEETETGLGHYQLSLIMNYRGLD